MKHKSTSKRTSMTILILAMLLTLAMPMPAQAASIRKLNKTSITLTVKKSCKLKVSGVAKKKVKWRTSNKKVASVNKNGKVVAKKKGTAIITAKVSGKNYKCKVKVVPKHTHKWVQDYKTIHHDAQYKNKQVLVKGAWDEQVKVKDEVWETKIVSDNFQCQCGTVFPNRDTWNNHSMDAEFAGISGHQAVCIVPGKTTRTKLSNAVYKTVHHDAQYRTEKQLVKKAYDEKVANGHKCSICGAKK